MAYKYVSGYLNVHEREGHPDNGLPVHGHPDHDLPGHGHPGNALPVPPGGTLPAPPPGIWPPPSWNNPILPAPPGTPPGTIWPSPGLPDHPGNALPGGGHVSGQPVPGSGRPDNTLPGSPSHPSQGLPSNIYWMLCYTPNLGWKFVAVDPSLKPGTPPTGEVPPTEAAPK